MSTDTNESIYFEIDGNQYHKEPTLDEFIDDAGLVKSSQHRRVALAFDKADITDIRQVLLLSEYQLSELEGISPVSAKQLYLHSVRVRSKGSFVKTVEEILEVEQRYDYLMTGSMQLDLALYHPTGNFGWRSNTMVELVGEPNTGKTQLLYTTAVNAMSPPEKGGWNCSVLWIDTTNTFSAHRLQSIAEQVEVDISHKLFVAKPMNFDELELALHEAFQQSDDIRLIIIDDIITPLKSQYPTGGHDIVNIKPKQKHLRRVLHHLRNFAYLYNGLVMYTNHVRKNIFNYRPGLPEEVPTGGFVLSYANTMRIVMEEAPRSTRDKYIDSHAVRNSPSKMIRARITNCGFLPDCEGAFLLGKMGITHASPDALKDIIDEWMDTEIAKIDGFHKEHMSRYPGSDKKRVSKTKRKPLD